MRTALAVLLLASSAYAALASSEGPAVKGCCLRPTENPPRAPQKRALCFGTLWSTAQPGKCAASEPGESSTCRENALTTLVMLREYTLTWDERLKQCVLVTSGRSWPAPVPTCDGNSC